MRGNSFVWFCLTVLCTACGQQSTATQPSKVASSPAAAPTGSSQARSAKAQPEDIPEVTPEELTAAPGHLELGEITLLTDGKPGLVLHPDGTVELPGEKRVVGHLDRDGTFTDPGGVPKVRFHEDGEITLGDSDDKFLPVIIQKDGTLKLLKENAVVRILPDGTVVGTNPNGSQIKVVGANEKTYRTAMFLLVLVAYPVR